MDLRIRQRFTAVVKPLEVLFEYVDTVGPFKVMLPVRSSGEAPEAVRNCIFYVSAWESGQRKSRWETLSSTWAPRSRSMKGRRL